MNLNTNHISRQDLVDNSIFDLLQTLNPTDKRLDWGIEMIADVRDVIQHHIISKTKCSEQDFYP